jgi:hypothetical protein
MLGMGSTRQSVTHVGLKKQGTPNKKFIPQINKNEMLMKRSDVFTADGKSIEKTIFLLFHGHNAPAAQGSIIFSNPDLVDAKQTAEVHIQLGQCVVEVSTETLNRLSQTLPFFHCLYANENCYQNRLVGLTS